MQIWYINGNNGDGSSSTEFYSEYKCIEYLCDDETGDERYWDGDGGSYGSFEVPDGTPITGITIQNFEEMRAEQTQYD